MRTLGKVVVGIGLLVVALGLANAIRAKYVPPSLTAPPTAAANAAGADRAAPSDRASDTASATTPAPATEKIIVAFKLDRDITAGHYLGERWVSPPTFQFAQPGKVYRTYAKLQKVGDDGTAIDLSGDWSTSDPEMIAISRDEPGQVTILVREPGEAQLVASAGGQRKVLHVRATRYPDAMEVAFVQ
ncbi:MAG: hypothetical protein HOQ01_13360 [Lysobacter sp.]|nr:hypothetical protein [Lysobacter sp.]